MEINAIKGDRRKNITGTSDRLLEAAAKARSQAFLLPPGRLQQELLRKARQAETTAHLNEWLTSRGLRPPR